MEGIKSDTSFANEFRDWKLNKGITLIEGETTDAKMQTPGLSPPNRNPNPNTNTSSNRNCNRMSDVVLFPECAEILAGSVELPQARLDVLELVLDECVELGLENAHRVAIHQPRDTNVRFDEYWYLNIGILQIIE